MPRRMGAWNGVVLTAAILIVPVVFTAVKMHALHMGYRHLLPETAAPGPRDIGPTAYMTAKNFVTASGDLTLVAASGNCGFVVICFCF